MAKKSVNKNGAGRGRAWVALVLLGFVLVAAAVIQRRTTGMAQALEIKRLQQELQAVESRRMKLESDIDAARDLGTLGVVAQEKLGMRRPEQTEMVIIPRQQR